MSTLRGRIHFPYSGTFQDALNQAVTQLVGSGVGVVVVAPDHVLPQLSADGLHLVLGQHSTLGVEEGAAVLVLGDPLAGEGAVLIAEDRQVFDKPAPKGHLVNAVGAGDSMVAGFMAGWMDKQDYEHAFCMGIASGSASAFSEYLATKSEIEAIYKQVRVED